MIYIDNIIRRGNIEEFNKAVKSGVGWDTIAKSSAFHGQREFLSIAMNNYDSNPLTLACSAARGGHIIIVDEMLDKCEERIEYFNSVACAAALGGHRNIVQQMIIRGANDYDGIALDAAMRHNQEIVIDMIELGANVPNLIRAILC